MAVISKTKASLRVIGDDLLPDDISSLLGCNPTVGTIKGQPFSWNKKGKPRIARSGMWRLEAHEKSPGDLDAQVSELLGQLTDNMDIWRDLADKYRIDLFCGLFMESEMEGISLSPKSVLALGLRSIEVDLDIYGPDDDNV